MTRRSELWARVALVVLAVAVAIAGQRMFSQRYSTGDVYPRFSSRSSDPEGTRALHDALRALPAPEVERSNRPLSQLADDAGYSQGTTLIVGGFPGWMLLGGESVPTALDRLASAGARVVLLLEPFELPEEEEKEATEDGTETADEEEAAQIVPDRELAAAEAAARWAFEVHAKEDDAPTAYRSADGGSRLPDEVVWRSNLHLGDLGEPWTVLYEVEGGAALAERRLGLGSVVLAAGNHFLTNRAQAEDRQVDLLAYLIGDAQRVVFDESHLGLVTSPGVVALGRRYRLHGVAIALVAVLALAVWRGMARLMPARATIAARVQAGRSSREGLVALLRRSIPEKRLLETCVERWLAGGGRGHKIDEARRISRAADPVAGYGRLAELLEPARRKR